MVRRRSRQAFSLVELMIVVVIIGGMVALMAPGLSELLADTRASGAASDLMRLSRHIRARVQQTGLAHIMVYSNANNATGSWGLGRIWVWEGMNNHCGHTPWISAYAAFAAAPATSAQAPVERLDMGDPQAGFNPTADLPAKATDSDRQILKLLAFRADSPDAQASIGICFQPNGLTVIGGWPDDGSGTANTIPVFTPHTMNITFVIERSVIRSGTPIKHGVPRQVVFAPGASGRFGL